MQVAAEAMLSAVQKTALAARQALDRTGQAAAGCQSAANTMISKQGAALKAFQDSFAASMAQDQVALLCHPMRCLYMRRSCFFPGCGWH